MYILHSDICILKGYSGNTEECETTDVLCLIQKIAVTGFGK